MKNTVIANRKKGDWEIIKKYFEDRGVDTSAFDGGSTEKNECKFYFYGVINGEFENYALLEAQEANAAILEVSDIISDTVTLPKSFVLELHDKLNYTFRKRIEEVVPELFTENEIPDELQTLIKKLGKDKIIEILNSN